MNVVKMVGKKDGTKVQSEWNSMQYYMNYKELPKNTIIFKSTWRP
jgi:hypothetical protein